MERAAMALAFLLCACGSKSGLLSGAGGPQPVSPPAARPSVPPEPEPEPEPEPTPAASAPCDDALGAALARVSCDGSRFLLAHAIELHPDRPVPEEPTKSVLHAVSDVLGQRPDILFVRIEVYVGEDVGTDPVKRRAALATAQRRADALLAYLWHKRGISPERLEAVGYEHDPRVSGAGGPRWPVVLRVVQRARR